MLAGTGGRGAGQHALRGGWTPYSGPATNPGGRAPEYYSNRPVGADPNDVLPWTPLSQPSGNLQGAINDQKAAQPNPYAPPPGFEDTLRNLYGLDIEDARRKRQYQIDLASRNLGYASQGDAFARRGYDIGLGGIGLQEQGTALDRALAARMLGNLGVWRGYNDREYAQAVANIEARQGTDTASLFQALRDNLQQAQAGAEAGGFAFAPGVQQGMGQTKQAAGTQWQAIIDAANYARQQAELGHAREGTSLDERGWGYENQISQFDLMSQKYGLDRDQARLVLDQKLAQSGMDRWMNSRQLEDLTNSSDPEERIIGDAVTKYIMEQYRLEQQKQAEKK